MIHLLLELWREACRHLEIGEAIERVVPLLAREFPLEWVLVRRFELARQRLETVAIDGSGEGPRPSGARTNLTGEKGERLVAWCREGRVLSGLARGTEDLAAALLPTGSEGSFLAGPLEAGEGPAGVLLFLSSKPRAFRPEHARKMQALLEPFGAALENDRRVHELARLREALEADKRALLSRLQRQDISDSVVGAEAGLRDVMERVEKVALTDAPVLVVGETGTGKEVIARAIHARSRRAEGPIVRVNCGAIPPELVDSELFGHEKGSFTGAVAAHKGWFERADGGTLFLDEIGELPLAAQVRLLRILQDGTFERVGSHSTTTVDVRLVAATHRELQEMVGEGRFREDLWYRISVFPIRLPALRERLGDLPELASHFAWRAGKRLAGVPLVPAPEDLELFLSYPWPGNVRELASVIERAAILGDGKRLDVAAALGVSRAPGRVADAARAQAQVVEEDTLEGAMRRHIEEALARAHGRIEGPHGAAQALRINPHTLRARMRKLGIDWASHRPNRRAPARRTDGGAGLRS